MNVAAATINDRIRLARENAGMSLNTLAKKVGMTPTGVWNWHHNNSTPRPDILGRVADALDVSVDWLRNGEQPAANQETLDTVLANARMKIANLLNVDTRRVRLTVSLDETGDTVPNWLVRARHLVDQLPGRPQGSDDLIQERHLAAKSGQ